MLKKTLGAAAVLLAIALAGCGGGGSSNQVVPSGNGGGPQANSVIRTDSDLFNLDGSDLLAMLEQDQGITVTSSTARHAQSAGPQIVVSSGTFKPQITGGTATIDRPASKGGPIQSVGFLMTYRDSSGLCECSNDNHSLPAPYAATIQNPNWHASPYKTAASTTTLLIGYNAKVSDNADHGGAYVFGANFDPNNTASFSILNPATVLPPQSKPTVTPQQGGIQISWTPAAGTKEYFLAFRTHLNNDLAQPIVVVGFVVTDKPYAFVKSSDLYSGSQYELDLIAADVPYIGVYYSQGVQQLPVLPQQVDFSIAQAMVFTAP
ncbi:MAG: hypothetical protein ACXVAM_18700 [Vulcanimicrobiaceae bacterium]